MAKDTILDVSPSVPQRINYGLGSKTDFRGMGTIPFFGEGEQLVENMQLDSGFYRKMRGNSVLATITGTESIPNITNIFQYEKSDGTFQVLETFQDSSTPDRWKLRAIEEDGTITVPTNDVEFESGDFGYAQIGLFGYVSNKVATSTAKELFSWDGATLTAVANTIDNPEFLSTDGQRLIMGAEGIVHFSGNQKGAEITDFQAGTLVDSDGVYNVTNQGLATGVAPVQGGVIIFFKRGAEFHTVQPNLNGDGLLGETKLQGWNYTGRGVNNNSQVAVAENNIFILNADGLIQIAGLTGQSVNLIEDAGAIRKIFDNLNVENSVMEYSTKEEMVVFNAIQGTAGVEDLLICYHLPYAVKGKRPFLVKTNTSVKSLGNVNNQLFGGGTVDGRVIKIFDSATFTDDGGSIPIARVLKEWDSMGGPKVEKRIQQVSAFVNLSPSSDGVSLDTYFNGSFVAVDSLSETTTDVGDTSSPISELGKYIMALGSPDAINNTDQVFTRYFNGIYGTIALAVEEQSDEDFRLYILTIDYTVTPSERGGKQFRTNEYATSIF